MKNNLHALLAFCLSTHLLMAQENAFLGWAKSVGGSDADTGGSIAVDNDGNVYTTGYFRNTADFDPGAGTFNLTATGLGAFISKLDADGNFVWAIELDGTQWERGFGIAVDNAGNVYSTGYFAGTVDFDPGPGTANLFASNSGCYILKLDTDGNFIWAKGTSGPEYEYGRAIAIDNSQNVYVTGEFSGTVDFDPGPGVATLTDANPNGDVFILKLDAAGDFVWAKNFVGASDDVARSIKVDVSGSVYTMGSFYNTVDFDPGTGVFNLISAGISDSFISKLDIDGNFVWAKQLGSTGNDEGQSLALDVSGNVYATGRFYETVDFDPGPGITNLTAQNADAFIVKLNTAGDFVWAKNISETGYGENLTIAVDTDGAVYTGGKFNGTVDFDPGVGIYNLAVVNGDCILKLDTDGNFVWAITYTGTSNELGMAITVDNNDNVHVTGQFFAADFDPSACVNELTSVATDVYILKLTQGPPIPEPTIVSFDPPQGSPGTTVTITGTNFSTTAIENVVQFNGITATVTASTSTTITTSVPAGASTGSISVSIGCNTSISADYIVTASGSPAITSFTPSSGPIGTTVIITGTNFDPTPSSNTVSFNGTMATVTSASATNLTVSVPVGATTGTISVSVGGNTATSITIFTVTTPTANQAPVIASSNTTTTIGAIASLDLTPLISDPDNNLDLSTLKIVSPPISGASAEIVSSTLTIDYSGISFAGTDRTTIEVCDLLASCAQQELTIEVEGDINVYTGVSPNSDLRNDIWFIQNIATLPDTRDNKVSIFNRWGDLIFETTNYDNSERVFTGVNKNGDEVPSGIYFYKIEFTSGRSQVSGYLNVKR
ncbi:MAG: IPT/TIG domain-containing protein [Cyclobacteriaceae bacterium]